MISGRENHNLNGLEPEEAEKLSYIMDMISELMIMATEVKSKTLSAILNAALVEARIQRNELDRDG